MVMRTGALLTQLSVLAGCASSVPIEGPVRLGQIAAVGGPRVRPERIIEDSRCPAGTQCAWAGRLVVGATVLGGGWSKRVTLTLGESVHVADGSLTLVAATRRGPSNPAIPPGEFRLTFEFQGGL